MLSKNDKQSRVIRTNYFGELLFMRSNEEMILASVAKRYRLNVMEEISDPWIYKLNPSLIFGEEAKWNIIARFDSVDFERKSLCCMHINQSPALLLKIINIAIGYPSTQVQALSKISL